jgi:hypothetical protein
VFPPDRPALCCALESAPLRTSGQSALSNERRGWQALFDFEPTVVALGDAFRR